MAIEVNVPIDPLSLEVPAIYTNRFQVVPTGQMVRISFAEQVTGQPPNYRTAVVLSVADAKELLGALSASVNPQ